MLRHVTAIEMGMNDAFGISGGPGCVKENSNIILIQGNRGFPIPSPG
jgi:hypothetical protein